MADKQSVVRSDFTFTTTRRGPGPRTHKWDELLDGEAREVLHMGNAKLSTFKALLWRAAKQRGKKVRTQLDPACERQIDAVSCDGNTVTVALVQPKRGEPHGSIRAGEAVDVAGVSEDRYNGHFVVATADGDTFTYELPKIVKDLPDAEGGSVARGQYLFVQGYVPEPGEEDEDEPAEAEAVNGDAKEEVVEEPVVTTGRKRGRK